MVSLLTVSNSTLKIPARFLYSRINIPPSLIGNLLSYTHLLGHKGTVRMIGDLQSYYFEKMYTLTEELVQSFWSYFLTSKGTRRVELGA